MFLICGTVTVKPLKEVYIDVKRQPDEKLKVPIRQWSERERENGRQLLGGFLCKI